MGFAIQSPIRPLARGEQGATCDFWARQSRIPSLKHIWEAEGKVSKHPQVAPWNGSAEGGTESSLGKDKAFLQ